MNSLEGGKQPWRYVRWLDIRKLRMIGPWTSAALRASPNV